MILSQFPATKGASFAGADGDILFFFLFFFAAFFAFLAALDAFLSFFLRSGKWLKFCDKNKIILFWVVHG